MHRINLQSSKSICHFSTVVKQILQIVKMEYKNKQLSLQMKPKKMKTSKYFVSFYFDKYQIKFGLITPLTTIYTCIDLFQKDPSTQEKCPHVLTYKKSTYD